MGRHLSPLYGHVILVSGYPVWQLLIDYSIDVQYQVEVPTLARKGNILHWFTCGADRRTGGGGGRGPGVRSRDYQNFLDG